MSNHLHHRLIQALTYTLWNEVAVMSILPQITVGYQAGGESSKDKLEM